MNKLRKFLVVSVMVLSVIAMSGVAVAPAQAAASAGDLIKMEGLSSVYYLGEDGKRYVFPNESTYFSWYADFSGVVTIPASELQSYPLGGNVTMRPGTTLVKITTDPTVYAVEPNGVLRSIVSEANAVTLFGTNWNKRIVDLADSFFTNYTIGAPLTVGQVPVGSLVKSADSATVYYWDGTNYRQFASEAAMAANRFWMKNILTVTNTLTAGGNNITGMEAGLVKTSQGGSTVGPVVTGSGLMVSLNAMTPLSQSVPTLAVNVPFTKVNFTAAADGPVTINSVTFTRSGIGSANDFSNVYLYDGNIRLTTGRSVNASTNQVTFTGLNYTVPAGTTKTLTLTTDIASAGNNNAFGITAASHLTTTGAAVTGSFPVVGNLMSIVSQSTGQITIAKTGSLSNVKVGEQNVKVAEFNLSASSVENLHVEGLTLYQSGTIANSNLTNLVLKQAGSIIATASGVNSSNNVVFNFSAPFALDKGQTKTFEVYANIGSTARSAETIILYVDNNADLVARGMTYGFGVAVVKTNYNGSSTPSRSETTVEAGQITIAYQGPAVTDYAVQDADVELFRFSVTAQNNVEVRNMNLNIEATGSATGGLVNSTATTSNYTDIKFVDVATNQVISGPKDVVTSGSDTTQDLSFNDVWNLNAGQTKTIKVTADIANFVPGESETVKVTLKPFGASDIKNLDNNTFVSTSDIVPSGSIAGSAHNVKAGLLTVSLAGTPSLQTYINGSSDLPMTGINFSAGSGKDVVLTSMTVEATGANSCETETNCVLSLGLYDGATQVGTLRSLGSDSKATFSGLNYNIAKGTNKTLVVKANLNTLSSVTSTTTLLVKVAEADINAQDSNGNNVSISGLATGPAHKITSGGTVSVAKAANVIGETDERLVVANTENNIIARYTFTAVNEPLRMNKMRIAVQATTGAGATSSAAATEITGISLWHGATQITNVVVPSIDGDYAVADFNSTVANFDIPKDASADLTVRVNYNSTAAGARSGVKLTAYLVDNSNFEFRGIGTNTVKTAAENAVSYVAGNPVYLYKSIASVQPVTLPSTSLTAGTHTIARFSVTADAKGVIEFSKIGLAVTKDNATTTNFRLVDEANNQLATSTTANDREEFTLSTVQQVAAGTTKTYSIRADVVVGTGSASVSTSFPTVSDFVAPAAVETVNATTATFVWSDDSVLGAGDDFMNDFRIRSLPLDSQTMSKS
jgi:hypothetical protein